MARISARFTAQNANSATLPYAGVMAIAGQDLILREVGVFNDGTTGVPTLKLARVTAAGTVGTGITANNVDFANHTILGTAKNAWSVAPTMGADVAHMPLGAAQGGGMILTFYGDRNGLLIPAGTANGIVLLTTSATNQALSGYFIWDE